MKHKIIYIFAFLIIPLLAYLATISFDAVVKSSILLGIPSLMYFAFHYFSHKEYPIYMVGDVIMRQEILDDIVHESKVTKENGDVMYDLMFCQLINVGEMQPIHSTLENCYYFYSNKPPPSSFVGYVVVDNVMASRQVFPDHKLCKTSDFYKKLQLVGNFE